MNFKQTCNCPINKLIKPFTSTNTTHSKFTLSSKREKNRKNQFENVKKFNVSQFWGSLTPCMVTNISQSF